MGARASITWVLWIAVRTSTFMQSEVGAMEDSEQRRDMT